MVEIPVWMPWVSADVPGAKLVPLEDSTAVSGLLTRARQGPLAFALTITDDDILEINILDGPPPHEITGGNYRVTAQQHLDYWLEKFREAYNGADANTQVRRQARREVAYWRREVRVEHRRLSRGD
jgi:hypothetical protein